MITFDRRRLGEPKLSIVLAITPDFTWQVDALERWFIEWDYLDVEIIAGVVTDEPFKEQTAKNKAAEAAESDIVVFTNAGIYPPPTLVEWTAQALTQHPEAFAQAYRVDGCPDYGVFVNPYAVGDWQGLTKATLAKIGGYDEDLIAAAWIDSDFLLRAYNAGVPVIVAQERVFHAYHKGRIPDSEYQERAARNVEIMKSKGRQPVVFVWPQSPRHPKYWDCVKFDKGRRIGEDV